MQTSIFDSELMFPQCHEDILELWKVYIDEGEKDVDKFSWNDIKLGTSYSFYGTKVLEINPQEDGKTKLKIPDDIMVKLFPEKKGLKEGQFYTVSSLSSEQMHQLVNLLKEKKKYIFRNTITYTFACCNSFVQCSDAKQCLHSEDRDYNGCYYRRNLEMGRIFYGKNRNID